MTLIRYAVEAALSALFLVALYWAAVVLAALCTPAV